MAVMSKRARTSSATRYRSRSTSANDGPSAAGGRASVAARAPADGCARRSPPWSRCAPRRRLVRRARPRSPTRVDRDVPPARARVRASVGAYGWLLVDRYPPFRLTPRDYPVHAIVRAVSGAAARGAVPPRAVPAGLVPRGPPGRRDHGALAGGLGRSCSCDGRCPGPPRSGRGDGCRTTSASRPTLDADRCLPEGRVRDPAAPEPPDAEESPLASPVPPLTLSRGAKRLVAVVLVLGAVYLAGGGYADVKLRQPSRTAGERTAVARDYEQLAVSMSLYAQGVGAARTRLRKSRASTSSSHGRHGARRLRGPARTGRSDRVAARRGGHGGARQPGDGCQP